MSNNLPVEQTAVESAGGVIVWQFAGEEAMTKADWNVRAFCDKDVPLLLKYRHFRDDDRTEWTIFGPRCIGRGKAEINDQPEKLV